MRTIPSFAAPYPAALSQGRRLRKLALQLLLTLGTAVLVAACGGDSEPTPTPLTEPQATATAAANAPTPVTATEAMTDTGSGTGINSGSGAASVAPAVPRPEVVAEGGASDLQPVERNGMYETAPAMTIDPAKFYYATLKTAKGDIKVQLFADRAPQTVNNFVFLAGEGFYNDTTFHRVLDGFMAQAGDPTGTGSGGPGYQFGDEFSPTLTFDRPGLLAMANSGPGTNGSQFFITFAPTDWLNGMHTIFGEVIEGQTILDSLTRRDPAASPTDMGDTVYTVIIEETDASVLPPPPPTPTPFAPSSLDSSARPLATVAPAERAGYFNTAPEVVIDTAKQYTATMTTSRGDLTIALYDDEAPTAVNNFVLLARLGFYDGLAVNQISPGQLVIIGAPDNDPNSDAGYKIQAEANLSVTLAVGIVGYVPIQAATPTSSSSQLVFALVTPPVEAAANFSFFGQVIGGVDLLPQLTTEDTVTSVTITESE